MFISQEFLKEPCVDIFSNWAQQSKLASCVCVFWVRTIAPCMVWQHHGARTTCSCNPDKHSWIKNEKAKRILLHELQITSLPSRNIYTRHANAFTGDRYTFWHGWSWVVHWKNFRKKLTWCNGILLAWSAAVISMQSLIQIRKSATNQWRNHDQNIAWVSTENLVHERCHNPFMHESSRQVSLKNAKPDSSTPCSLWSEMPAECLSGVRITLKH